MRDLTDLYSRKPGLLEFDPRDSTPLDVLLAEGLQSEEQSAREAYERVRRTAETDRKLSADRVRAIQQSAPPSEDEVFLKSILGDLPPAAAGDNEPPEAPLTKRVCGPGERRECIIGGERWVKEFDADGNLVRALLDGANPPSDTELAQLRKAMRAA